MIGGSPHIQEILCDTSWMSYNSIKFWHYLPGDSVRFHRLRAQSYKTAPLPNFRWQSPRLSPVLPPYGLYRLEILRTPSLDLVNLLEWHTELRETFYLLDHRFIVKGYNLGPARWKRCIGQRYVRWGSELPCLVPEHLSPNLHMVPNTEALPTLSFGFLYIYNVLYI